MSTLDVERRFAANARLLEQSARANADKHAAQHPGLSHWNPRPVIVETGYSPKGRPKRSKLRPPRWKSAIEAPEKTAGISPAAQDMEV
jgi:hypothetical protein